MLTVAACSSSSSNGLDCSSVRATGADLDTGDRFSLVEMNSLDLKQASTAVVRDLPLVTASKVTELLHGHTKPQCDGVSASLDLVNAASGDELARDLALPEGWTYSPVRDGGTIDTKSKGIITSNASIAEPLQRTAAFLSPDKHYLVVQYSSDNDVYSAVWRTTDA
jgi:hypothetical protein